jgi:hypothetical protein
MTGGLGGVVKKFAVTVQSALTAANVYTFPVSVPTQVPPIVSETFVEGISVNDGVAPAAKGIAPEGDIVPGPLNCAVTTTPISMR